MKRKLFSLVLLVISGSIKAQDEFKNTGNLQIYSGASITGFGSFTNSSLGALVNNGSFYIKGILTNDQSSMAAGSGTLYLNGSSAQSVAGTQPFKTYNLVSNNSAGITLNNNLSVSGVHTFTSGLIATSVTPNYLIYESGSSYSGSGDTKHVNGWVKKIGSTNFTFPVGDATYERTAAISNLSAASEFNCHYYTPTQNIGNLAIPVLEVKQNEYWQIDKISGGTAKITLNWDHSKVPMSNFALTDILVSHYTGGFWTDAGGVSTATGNTMTTGSVTSNAVNSFSPFTIGSIGFILPLKLVSFTGKRRSGTTFLTWISNNEQDVDYFDIQRSLNATAFITIGKMDARNSGNRELYNFDDPFNFLGIVYYRLRMVDIDGKYSYSKIIAVSEKNIDASGFITLNPARNVITIFNKSAENGPFDYTLYNTYYGQLVMKGVVTMEVNGIAVLPLPGQTASGIYILELRNKNIHYKQNVLVEKK